MNDAEKLKPILDGLMTVHTCGSDTITMAQCIMMLGQYINEHQEDTEKSAEKAEK